jgi:uncharacterized protein (DUF1697 family)
MAETCVVLLRAINVGGHNPLPMKALAGFFEEAGATAVRTYVQSGNVVIGAGRSRVPGILRAVEERIHGAFGHRPVMTWRSGAEWEAVASAHPFAARGREPARLHVAFLSERPAAALAEAFDGDRFPPDRAALRGREVYLWLPAGAGKSRWGAEVLERALGTSATMRNWRTVQEVAARL